jgi:hypothetical protein
MTTLDAHDDDLAGLFELAGLSPDNEPPLPFADSDEQLFDRWEPPQVPLNIAFDHLVGAPELDLLPEPTEPNEERALASRIRRLPRALRLLFNALKHHSRRDELIDVIETEARRRAGVDNFRYVEVPGQFLKHRYVPEIYRRAALQEMAADKKFLDSVRADAEATKRNGHLVNTYADQPRQIPELPVCRIPPGSPWKAESWLGLSTSSLPEALPEAVVVAIAQRFWQRFRHAQLGRRPIARVLHWGALHGTFAVALEALAPKRLTLEIDEIDTVGQDGFRSPAIRRSTELYDAHANYDLILVHAPPPAAGANQMRNRYKDLANPSGGEREHKDIGRLGPRKWRKHVKQLLACLPRRLKPTGELYIVLPTAMRVAPCIGRYPHWGYDASPLLIDGLVEPLTTPDLKHALETDIEEVNPLEQPFFRRLRCPWRLSLLCPNPDEGGDDLFAGLEEASV